MNTFPCCPACGAPPLREGEVAEVGATVFPCTGCGVMLRFALVAAGLDSWHARAATADMFLAAVFASAKPLTIKREKP